MPDNKKKVDEMLDLARREGEAVVDAEIASIDAQNQREMADQAEIENLNVAQTAEASALKDYNNAQYQNMGQIIEAAEAKIADARQKDEVARRRENAFRYISGLGDTLSGVANLIGTAHGASNQNQTYNSHAVVQKAEEARKARKLKIEDLSKRLDEMTTRQRELKAAGSLEEAKLAAQHAKDMATLQSKQRTAGEAAQRYADERADRALRYAREDWQKERAFNAQQEQVKQAQDNWQKNYDLQLAKFNEEQKGNKYNFTLSTGSIDIPKEKINDANIERIFQMLPEEMRSAIKGEQYTEIVPNDNPLSEPVKKTSYKAPSIAQKLAAIAAEADNNPAIQNELRRLAGMKIQDVDPNNDPDL